MAKKPKDIWDLPSPSDVVEFMNRAVRTGQVASGDREALPGTADAYLNVRGIGKTISQANDLVNPFANTTKQLLGIASGNPGAEAKFAKSLAGEAAITAALAGVGVAVGKGAKAVVKTGLPARFGNIIRNEKVVVHASPIKGMTSIEPRLGSNQLPEENVVFGWDPQKPGMDYRITRAASPYLTKNQTGEVGSYYVAKIKNKEIVTPQHLKNSAQVVSSGPAKVVGEVSALNKDFKVIDTELKRQLRLAGAPAKPQVSRTADVIEKTKKKVAKVFKTEEQKRIERLRSYR